MKRRNAIFLVVLASCFAEEMEMITDASGSDESGSDSEDSESSSSSTTDATDATGATTRLPSESTDSTGESSSSSEDSTGETPKFCSFSGAPCENDAECGIPGVCYASTQSCFHWCATDDDCPEGLSCFVMGAFGSYCVDCAGDSSACAGGATCDNGSDCAEAQHDECFKNGKPCTISDMCV